MVFQYKLKEAEEQRNYLDHLYLSMIE